MTVLRTKRLQPLTRETHEISEPARVRLKSVPEKSQSTVCQCVSLRSRRVDLSQQHREDKCASIVVRAIAFMEVGDVIDRVLEYACAVAHRQQMIQLERRHWKRVGWKRGGHHQSVAHALARLAEAFHVSASDHGPDHFATAFPGSFPNGSHARRPREQIIHRLGDRLRIAEWHQHTAL